MLLNFICSEFIILCFDLVITISVFIFLVNDGLLRRKKFLIVLLLCLSVIGSIIGLCGVYYPMFAIETNSSLLFFVLLVACIGLFVSGIFIISSIVFLFLVLIVVWRVKYHKSTSWSDFMFDFRFDFLFFVFRLSSFFIFAATICFGLFLFLFY